MGDVSLLVCGAILTQVLGIQLQATGRSMTEITSRAIAAANPDDAAKCFRDLLRAPSPEELRALKHEDNIGISLAAAWKEMCETHHQGGGKVRDRQRIRQEAASYFLGFLDARTGADAPSWWKRSLHDATIDNGRDVSFPKSDKYKYHETLIGLMSPKRTIIREMGRMIEISVDDKRLVMQRDVLECNLRKSGSKVNMDQVAIFCGQEQYYIGMHYLAGFSFRLGCFNVDDHLHRWTADIWAVGRRGLVGKSYHMVEVRETGSSVLVYGIEPNGLYVEGYDVKTGKALFRFSSNNWHVYGD